MYQRVWVSTKDDMINFNADNLITIWYPQYSGGKFIMNCMSLSRHAVPLCPTACDYLIDHPQDYEYRLNAMLKTLPPKDRTDQWLRYEFNTALFYDGFPVDIIDSEFKLFSRMQNGDVRNSGIDLRIAKLIDKDIDFFAESRASNIRNLNQYLRLWPNSRIIMLTNFTKFQHIAQLKKRADRKSLSTVDYCGNECQEKYDLLKGEDWPDWDLFENCNYNIDKVANYVKIKEEIRNEIKQFYPWHDLLPAKIFNFDIDGSIFDEGKFVKQMKRLYDWANYDDFNEELLLKYYRPYIEIHKD